MSDLRQFTDEERLAYWELYVAYAAEVYRQEIPPDLVPERWIRPDEAGPVLGRCLSEEFGYDVTYDTFPGLVGGPNVLNGGEFDPEHQGLAYFTCRARFPVDPMYMIPFADDRVEEMMAMFEGWVPYTPDQVRVTFEFLEEAWIPCVRDQGWDVPDLPDKQTFIDQFPDVYLVDPPSGSVEACGLMQPSDAAYFGY